MVKISTRCRYGARALIEIAAEYGREPVKRKDIAGRQDISDSYLENILISLKSAGIINTLRGANGGYSLAMEPSKISLYDIVKALDGMQSPIECLKDTSKCERADECLTKDVWFKVKQAEEGVLKGVTLQDLLDKKKKTLKSDYVI
jgi:Rrf2 family protein